MSRRSVNIRFKCPSTDVSNGITTDWTAGVAGIDINFTFELRDTGRYGFLLPADQIIPCAQEVLAAMEVLWEQTIPGN